MSYEIDYGKVLSKVLADVRIKPALVALSQDELADLLRQLGRREGETRGLLASRLKAYDDAEIALQRRREEVDRLREPPALPGSFEVLAGWLGFLIVMGIIGQLAGWAFAQAFIAALVPPPFPTWQQIATVLFLFVTIASGIGRLRWQRGREALEAQLDNDAQLATLSEGLREQAAAIEAQLLDLNIKSAFEFIGRGNAPFFQGRLVLADGTVTEGGRFRITSPGGLSEVSEEGHEVSTVARREIMYLLEKLPGASIGLSGPRGAGKSTILRSLTAANLPLRGKEAIAIYTAAPVDYEARDFLLHLFSTLCRQVLQTYHVEEEAGGSQAATERAQQWFAKLRRVGSLLFWLGIGLTLWGLLLATLVWSWSAAPQPATFLQSLDLKSGPLLLLGLTAIVLGLCLRIYAGVQAAVGDDGAALPEQTRRLLLGVVGKKFRPLPPPEPPLVIHTRKELRDIRFQRSYTEGWSGAIKLPVGIEMGSTSSVALAQRQESFPELVERFNSYARTVAATPEHGAVVIAVDELDKLKAADEAEEFINGVKSIFAIKNCFFLISVSEDALSAFERRGLSLRDAFDSAFDDIRYIGYKTLAGSRSLLLRRLIDFPDPFVCLCHILSGGLPRDLIRIARAIVQLAPATKSPTITAIARRLVQEEAAAKVRATRTAMRGIAVPETDQLASALAALSDHPVWTAGFARRLGSLAVAPREGPDAAELAKLISIQKELAAYLEFLTVTVQVAEMLSTEAGWEIASKRIVDRLAGARQALEASASIGLARVAEVRALLLQERAEKKRAAAAAARKHGARPSKKQGSPPAGPGPASAEAT